MLFIVKLWLLFLYACSELAKLARRGVARWATAISQTRSRPRGKKINALHFTLLPFFADNIQARVISYRKPPYIAATTQMVVVHAWRRGPRSPKITRI